MTAFYMFRLYGMTFLGKFRGSHAQQGHLHESPAAITFPLIILAILSFIGGWINIPEVFVKGGDRLQQFLSPVFAQSAAIAAAHETDTSKELMWMIISTVLILIIIFIAIAQYKKYSKDNQPSSGIGKLLENKWYIDEIYNAIIVRPIGVIALFFKKCHRKIY